MLSMTGTQLWHQCLHVLQDTCALSKSICTAATAPSCSNVLSGSGTCMTVAASQVPPRKAAADRFTKITLGPFRRIFISETADGYLTALCLLVPTVAAGAMLARLLLCHFGAQRTPSSLEREVLYTSMLAPQLPRRLRPNKSTSQRADNQAPDAKHSAAVTGQQQIHSRHQRRWHVPAALAAVLAWIGVESCFMFFGLPASFDVNFSQDLRHVAVEHLTNFGPSAGRNMFIDCRTITWDADGFDIAQRVHIRRCAHSSPAPYSALVAAKDTNTALNSAAKIVFVDAPAIGAHVATAPAIGGTSGFTLTVTTIAYIEGAGTALPLNVTLDMAALTPYIRARLTGTSCALAHNGPEVCQRPLGQVPSTTHVWTLQCSYAEMLARNASLFERAANVLFDHVDLRTQPMPELARSTNRTGLSASLAGSLHAYSPHESALEVALQAPAVVGRATGQRVNLLTALLLALGGAVVFVAAQCGSESAAHVALRNLPVPSGMSEAAQLEDQAVRAEEQGMV